MRATEDQCVGTAFSYLRKIMLGGEAGDLAVVLHKSVFNKRNEKRTRLRYDLTVGRKLL